MTSKSILTVAVVVSVTILSGCGDNKSKKAKFRGDGHAIALTNVGATNCNIKTISPGGKGTVKEQCDLSVDNFKAAATAPCKTAVLKDMQNLKCDAKVISDLTAEVPETKTVGRVADAPPGDQVTVDVPKDTPVTDTKDLATLADATVAKTVVDPQTGDRTTDALSVNTLGSVDPAAIVPTPESLTIPKVATGSDEAATGSAALCTAEQAATAKADDASCGLLKRVNDKAARFASSLDIQDTEKYNVLSNWARATCMADSERATGDANKANAELLEKEISAVVTTSSTWTSADRLTKCSSEVSRIAIACRESIVCGGKKDIVWPARLTSETAPADDTTVATDAK